MKYDSKGMMIDIGIIIIIIIHVEMQSFNSLEINVQIKLSEVSSACQILYRDKCNSFSKKY